MWSLLPSGVAAAAVGGFLSWVLDPAHPLIAAPLVVGAGGLVYVGLAYLRGSPSAADLLKTARVLR